MTTPADYLMNQATKLVRHCERCNGLLRTVLEWSTRGDYDPISDIYAIRLPGDVVRTIQTLLEPAEPGDS